MWYVSLFNVFQQLPSFLIFSYYYFFLETAMGVKLDNHNAGDSYRRNILKMGQWLLFRAVNVWLHTDFFYKITGLSVILNRYVKRVHNFSWSVIDRRKKEFYSFHAEDKTDEQDDSENM